jgi:putative ABC transport system substrate-binding protein
LQAAISVAGSSLAAAQSRPSKGKVGYLHPASLSSPTSMVLGPVLHDLGYVDGQTVIMRAANGDLSRIPALLDELVDLGAGVLIVVGPQTVKTVSAHVRSVPIVAIDLESDPVREGFVESFAQARGNITGLFMDFPEVAGKWLQLLREVSPGMDRVVVLWDPSTGSSQREAAEEAAQKLRLEAAVVEVRSPEEQRAALRRLGLGRTAGVVQLGSPVIVAGAATFVEPLLELKLPSISYLKPIAKAGGLMSYGPNIEAYLPRAVILADRILSGARPADLPIEKPDRFEFTVNLHTARAVDLTIPSSLLVSADEVIG